MKTSIHQQFWWQWTFTFTCYHHCSSKNFSIYEWDQIYELNPLLWAVDSISRMVVAIFKRKSDLWKIIRSHCNTNVGFFPKLISTLERIRINEKRYSKTSWEKHVNKKWHLSSIIKMLIDSECLHKDKAFW